jgi:hypothetical protein
MGFSVGAALAIELGAEAGGVIATGAGILGSGVVGAGLGAGLSAVEGGDPGQGALFGGLGGAALGGLGAAFGGGAGGAAVGGVDSVGATGGAATADISAAAGTAAPLSGATAAGGLAGGAGSIPADLTSANLIQGLGPATADIASPIAAVGSPAAAAGLDATATGVLSSLGGGVTADNALLNAPTGSQAGVQDFLKTGVAPQGSVGAAAPTFTQGGGSSLDNLAGKLGTGAINSLTKNPIGTAIAGGGLINNLFNQPSQPNLTALQNEANTLSSQGSTLQSYLQSGTLPPGAQAAITQATQGAIANMVSNYASRGQDVSKNPDGTYRNSTLQQEVNNIQQAAASQAFKTADTLLQQGVQQSGLAGDIYSELLNISQQQGQQTGSAIANLSAALAGGGTPAKAA